jgi:hypothetical protein
MGIPHPSTIIYHLVFYAFDKVIDERDCLCWLLGMYSVSGIEGLQSHIREELLSDRDIVFIEILRMLPFHEHCRALPMNS